MTQPVSATSSGGSGLPSWVLLLGGALLVLLAGGFFIWVFGAVVGQEFSPHTFQRRSYYYWQIPLVGWQITPAVYQVETTGPEVDLQGLGVLPPPAAPAEWHYLGGLMGGDQRQPVVILINYLDSHDSGLERRWVAWSKKHKAPAGRLWQAVADVARRGEYHFIPDLFDVAERYNATYSTPDHLERSLQLSIALLREREAERLLELGQTEPAIEEYTHAIDARELAHLLQARANAFDTAGKSDEARRDRERAETLLKQGEQPAESPGETASPDDAPQDSLGETAPTPDAASEDAAKEEAPQEDALPGETPADDAAPGETVR